MSTSDRYIVIPLQDKDANQYWEVWDTVTTDFMGKFPTKSAANEACERMNLAWDMVR